MIHIKKFESYDDALQVKMCEKSKLSYDFASQYLDLIDYESYINNKNLHQYCLYINGDIVGISIFKMSDSKIHINYNAIKEEFRNKGYNKKLNEKIIEFGKKKFMSFNYCKC